MEVVIKSQSGKELLFSPSFCSTPLCRASFKQSCVLGAFFCDLLAAPLQSLSSLCNLQYEAGY